MKTTYEVTICNQKFISNSFEDLQKQIRDDLLVNTWLTDNGINKFVDFVPTKVTTYRFLRKPKVDVVDFYYEVDPINYWAE